MPTEEELEQRINEQMDKERKETESMKQTEKAVKK